MIIELIAVICIADTTHSTPHCDHVPVFKFSTLKRCEDVLYENVRGYKRGTQYVMLYCKERRQ